MPACSADAGPGDKEAALVEFFGRDDLGKGDALDAAGFSLSVMLRAVFEYLANDGAGVAPWRNWRRWPGAIVIA